MHAYKGMTGSCTSRPRTSTDHAAVTLLADTRKGSRPSFTAAALPERAEPLVERFVDALRAEGVRVETGRFGALMEVELVNDGPVTIVLDQ